MKLKIIIASIFLIYSANSFSQKLTLGAKAGINFNKLSGNPFNDHYSPNFHFGGFVVFKICKHLDLQPELLYSKINSDTSRYFNYAYNFNQVEKVQLEYLYLPILLNFKINKFLSIQTGPQVNFLIHDNLNSKITIHDPFKEVELAADGGMSFHVKQFSIYGRYVIGINTQNNIHEIENWKNESLQLGIQYLIPHYPKI